MQITRQSAVETLNKPMRSALLSAVEAALNRFARFLDVPCAPENMDVIVNSAGTRV